MSTEQKRTLGAQVGVIKSKAYPDRTVGYDGYVVMPDPVGPCFVDTQYHIAWESKYAVVLLKSRATKEYVATLTCERGTREEREGEIDFGDNRKLKCVLVAKANGSVAVFLPRTPARPRASL